MNGGRAEPGRRLLDEALRLLDVAQATRPVGAHQDASCSPDEGSNRDCRICPICRGIAYLREMDPEAVERLTGAVADVAAAVRDLLGATAPEDQGSGDATTAGAGGHPGAPRVRVQHIDVTD